jgi:hypothetical protein
MQYVSDDGATYQRRTYTDLATAVGNTAEASGAHPKLPRGIKPRYLLCNEASGRTHRLIVGSTGNALWAAAQTATPGTVTLPNPDNRATAGSNVTATCAVAVGEKRYKR